MRNFFHTSDILPGDYFYLGPDGMLESPEMENGEYLKNIFSKKVRSIERKAQILTKVTEKNEDNHSAIIIHIIDVKKANVTEKKLTKFSIGIITAVISVLAVAIASILAFLR